MKPCDCKSTDAANKILLESGIAFSSTSIEVVPPNVIIKSGPCTLVIGQFVFDRFARWYLEDQG